MHRAVFGKQVAGEVVTPVEQRHLQLELRGGAAASEHDMIGRTILEAAAGYDPDILGDVTKPELSRVDEVRSEGWEDDSAHVAPLRFPHQPGSAVAVEHPAMIERAQLSRGDRLAHA